MEIIVVGDSELFRRKMLNSLNRKTIQYKPILGKMIVLNT